MHGTDLLSWLIWLPIGGGLLVLALGDARARLARWLALAATLADLLLCVPLGRGFDHTTAAFQYVETSGSRSCTPSITSASTAFPCR